MSGIYGKGLKGKATELHSLYVRKSRGRCECCGDDYWPNLQCAHVVTRERNATRTDETAAFCLCKRCHMRFTHDPLEWIRWVDSMIGPGAHDEIQRRSKVVTRGTKAHWQGEVDRLTALIEGLE